PAPGTVPLRSLEVVLPPRTTAPNRDLQSQTERALFQSHSHSGYDCLCLRSRKPCTRRPFSRAEMDSKCETTNPCQSKPLLLQVKNSPAPSDTSRRVRPDDPFQEDNTNYRTGKRRISSSPFRFFLLSP